MTHVMESYLFLLFFDSLSSASTAATAADSRSSLSSSSSSSSSSAELSTSPLTHDPLFEITSMAAVHTKAASSP